MLFPSPVVLPVTSATRFGLVEWLIFDLILLFTNYPLPASEYGKISQCVAVKLFFNAPSIAYSMHPKFFSLHKFYFLTAIFFGIPIWEFGICSWWFVVS